MENELDVIHKSTKTNEIEILKKVDKNYHDIWDHFQRFAEYKDLKQLHTIVIPEIAKFE